MRLSPAGLALLKKSEGFRSHAYRDVNGVATIGYGHRLLAAESYPDGVDENEAAELLLGMRRFGPNSSTSLYVYARETVGYALVIGGRVHSPASGPGTITNLPA